MSVRPAKTAWVFSYPLSERRRLWSDWADAQADLKTSDETGLMTRLIWVFAGRAVTLLVLSCRSSITDRRQERTTCTKDQKWTPLELVYLFLHHVDNKVLKDSKKCDGNQVWKISEVDSLPINVFSIAKIGKIVKNEIIASTCILPLLGREMIKISGLGADLG